MDAVYSSISLETLQALTQAPDRVCGVLFVVMDWLNRQVSTAHNRLYRYYRHVANWIKMLQKVSFYRMTSGQKNSYAYTVIRIKTLRRIVIQEDNALMTGGTIYDETQEYAFSCNPDGETKVLWLNKQGQWQAVGDRVCKFTIGRRSQRRDPHR